MQRNYTNLKHYFNPKTLQILFYPYKLMTTIIHTALDFKTITCDSTENNMISLYSLIQKLKQIWIHRIINDSLLSTIVGYLTGNE